jgi:hypothetical protein
MPLLRNLRSLLFLLYLFRGTSIILAIVIQRFAMASSAEMIHEITQMTQGVEGADVLFLHQTSIPVQIGDLASRGLVVATVEQPITQGDSPVLRPEVSTLKIEAWSPKGYDTRLSSTIPIENEDGSRKLLAQRIYDCLTPDEPQIRSGIVTHEGVKLNWQYDQLNSAVSRSVGLIAVGGIFQARQIGSLLAAESFERGRACIVRHGRVPVATPNGLAAFSATFDVANDTWRQLDVNLWAPDIAMHVNLTSFRLTGEEDTAGLQDRLYVITNEGIAYQMSSRSSFSSGESTPAITPDEAWDMLTYLHGTLRAMRRF